MPPPLPLFPPFPRPCSYFPHSSTPSPNLTFSLSLFPPFPCPCFFSSILLPPPTPLHISSASICSLLLQVMLLYWMRNVSDLVWWMMLVAKLDNSSWGMFSMAVSKHHFFKSMILDMNCVAYVCLFNLEFVCLFLGLIWSVCHISVWLVVCGCVCGVCVCDVCVGACGGWVTGQFALGQFAQKLEFFFLNTNLT